jgi:Zn-dependent peptidase ImmA (M78 family)
MSDRLIQQFTYWTDSVLSRRTDRSSKVADALLKVRNVRTSRIGDSIPADLKRLASNVGIAEVRFTPLPMRGRLIVEQSSLVAEINRELSELDGRFVLAHEIAHVILEKHLGTGMKRHSDMVAEKKNVSEREYRSLENLCDEAAKEILMPLPLLRRSLTSQRPSLSGLMAIADQAQAGPEVIASQVLRTRQWECSYFWWRYWKNRWTAVASLPHRPEDELLWWDIENASSSIIARSITQEGVVRGPITIEDSHMRLRYKNAEALSTGDGIVLLMLGRD